MVDVALSLSHQMNQITLANYSCYDHDYSFINIAVSIFVSILLLCCRLV